MNFSCDINNDWRDITVIFEKSALKLNIGELFHGEEFSLYEAMSAIEIMEPKMDSGFLYTQNQSKINSFSSAFNKDILKLNCLLSKSDFLIIFDYLMSSIYCWLDGQSLAQTVFTCLYTHNVELIEYKLLKVTILSFLQWCQIINCVIVKSDVYEVDDFQFSSFGFDLAQNYLPNQLIHMLVEEEQQLLTQMPLNDILPIVRRLQYLRTMLHLFSAIAEYCNQKILFEAVEARNSSDKNYLTNSLKRLSLSQNDGNDNAVMNDDDQSSTLSDLVDQNILNLIEKCCDTLNTIYHDCNLGKIQYDGIPANKESQGISSVRTDEDNIDLRPYGFDPLTNLRILPPSFPKPVRLPPPYKAYTGLHIHFVCYLKSMCLQFKEELLPHDRKSSIPSLWQDILNLSAFDKNVCDLLSIFKGSNLQGPNIHSLLYSYLGGEVDVGALIIESSDKKIAPSLLARSIYHILYRFIKKLNNLTLNADDDKRGINWLIESVLEFETAFSPKPEFVALPVIDSSSIETRTEISCDCGPENVKTNITLASSTIPSELSGLISQATSKSFARIKGFLTTPKNNVYCTEDSAASSATSKSEIPSIHKIYEFYSDYVLLFYGSLLRIYGFHPTMRRERIPAQILRPMAHIKNSFKSISMKFIEWTLIENQIYYVVLGFESDLYAGHELPYIYWYLRYLYSLQAKLLVPFEERPSEMSQSQCNTTNLPPNDYFCDTAPPKTESNRDYFLMYMLCDTYFILTSLLLHQGFMITPKLFNDEKTRFTKRFRYIDLSTFCLEYYPDIEKLYTCYDNQKKSFLSKHSSTDSTSSPPQTSHKDTANFTYTSKLFTRLNELITKKYDLIIDKKNSFNSPYIPCTKPYFTSFEFSKLAMACKANSIACNVLQTKLYSKSEDQIDGYKCFDAVLQFQSDLPQSSATSSLLRNHNFKNLIGNEIFTYFPILKIKLATKSES